MADIQFDEDQEFQRSTSAEQKPYFVRLVLSTGIVTTEGQANYVLVGIVVICLLSAFFIMSVSGSSTPGTFNIEVQHPD